mmetsp:Transcript_88045/g.146991  ORF Transcript_88045/g.146991 Transcript_88045/m.146991 type:complete len:165 (+) Transcript_88045:3-497(+)
MCGWEVCGSEAVTRVPRKRNFQPAEHIVDNIYLGPEGTTLNEAWLREHRIDRVLTVAKRSGHIKQFCGIAYLQLDVDDDPSEDIRSHWEPAFRFIRKRADTNVLVHSVAGISRSVATVMAYIIQSRRVSFEKALAMVRNKRPSVSVNSGFQCQLRDYEAEVRAA